jgi:hypothetical protein
MAREIAFIKLRFLPRKSACTLQSANRSQNLNRGRKYFQRAGGPSAKAGCSVRSKTTPAPSSSPAARSEDTFIAGLVAGARTDEPVAAGRQSLSAPHKSGFWFDHLTAFAASEISMPA